MKQLSLFSNAPVRGATVQQQAGPGRSLAEPFAFYATFDVDSLCSYIPESIPVLLPASSWARKGLNTPRVPAHITRLAADSSGFVASRIWGEYRYSLEQYVTWLQSFRPLWAATMDYCCEPELAVVTEQRQQCTTENASQAWQHCQQLPFAWVPTIQGWLPEDYRRHASAMYPLIAEMQAAYANNPHWRVGVGTLCRRNDVEAVQAILDAIREVLPGIPLHLWGIKLDALRSLDLAQVVSTDSAAWHGNFGRERDETCKRAAEAHLSMRRYAVTVKLPAYVNRIHAAVAESRRVTAQQDDPGVLSQARHLLRMHGGWTLDILKRRNRTYAYAARRTGKRVKRRYLCAVARLEAWLAEPSSPAVLHGSDPIPRDAEQPLHEPESCATDNPNHTSEKGRTLWMSSSPFPNALD
jgi:hypothetical protein